MFTIGDVVQIDYDLINTPLKMGMLATVVHQYNDTAYEIEPFPNTLIEETFAVQSEQVTLVWSVKAGSIVANESPTFSAK